MSLKDAYLEKMEAHCFFQIFLRQVDIAGSLFIHRV